MSTKEQRGTVRNGLLAISFHQEQCADSGVQKMCNRRHEFLGSESVLR